MSCPFLWKMYCLCKYLYTRLSLFGSVVLLVEWLGLFVKDRYRCFEFTYSNIYTHMIGCVFIYLICVCELYGDWIVNQFCLKVCMHHLFPF